MSDVFDLRRFTTTAVRWLWLVVLICVVFTGVAYVLSARQPAVYQARATVVVGELIQTATLGRADVETSEILAHTFADMALRYPVLEPVASSLDDGTSWLELRERVRVESVAGTQLLEVIALAGSADTAREIADAVALQLVHLGPSVTQESESVAGRTFVTARLTDLRSRIESALVELDVASATASGATSQEARDTARLEVERLQLQISNWEANYIQMLDFLQQGSSPPNSLTVFEPAQALPEPVSPRPLLAALVGGLLGLIVSSGVVAVIGLRDVTIRSSLDVNNLLRLPVLGTVGQITGKSDASRLLLAQDSFSAAAEAYRIVRGNVEFKTEAGATNVIVVTSAQSGEGKSLTAANLSIVMAKAGLQTVLIDADLRRPTQRQLFGLPLGGGLSDAIQTGNGEGLDFLHHNLLPNLSVMTNGRATNNPTELLRSQGMRNVLEQLRQVTDVVVIDSPPVNGLSDATILANRADSTIMVVRSGRTQADAARRAIAALVTAEAEVIGVVLNRSEPDADQYYVATPVEPVTPDRLGAARPATSDKV